MSDIRWTNSSDENPPLGAKILVVFKDGREEIVRVRLHVEKGDGGWCSRNQSPEDILRWASLVDEEPGVLLSPLDSRVND